MKGIYLTVIGMNYVKMLILLAARCCSNYRLNCAVFVVRKKAD